MIPPWAYLDEHDRAAFRATVAFLEGRLADRATTEWALRLKLTNRIERIAIEQLLGSSKLDEPWLTAWRLVEESWSAGTIAEVNSTVIYDIRERLNAGDTSGAIVSTIVNLVAPRLKVEPIGGLRRQAAKISSRPRKFSDLLSAGLSSGDLVDLSVLKLDTIADLSFLQALANALEAAVNQGLAIGRRLGWDGHKRLWQLGGLDRAHYVKAVSHSGEAKDDPDVYHHGIAPSVKLLSEVVGRIANLKPAEGMPIMRRWRLAGSPIHVRLWAALATNPELVSAEELAAFLINCDGLEYWDLSTFPEVAELRAARFSDLSRQNQSAIVARLRKGPPRSFWPKRGETELIKNQRLYWAVRELRRIEVAGSELPPADKSWLDARSAQFTDLLAGMTAEEGFPESIVLHSVVATGDSRYDTLEGTPRLQSLETALASGRGGRFDDPAERASAWINQPEKALLILADLAKAENGGDAFPKVWNRFGWAHSPTQAEKAPPRNIQSEADFVLMCLLQLSPSTLSAAIEGVSNWLDHWRKQVVASPSGLPVWMGVWPIAVAATNSRRETEDEADLSVTAPDDNDSRNRMEIDTLNTPAGKLVGVFLAACPSLNEQPHLFGAGTAARKMRDALITASGRSGLIARHRLIEHLPYFLRADHEWAEQHLVSPLLIDDSTSLALWGAIARRTHFTEVLKIIGGAMAERATDRRLRRETRNRLVFSLVVETLHAFHEGRASAVALPRVQQMLRTVEDEVRASAANAVQQFEKEMSGKGAKETIAASAANLFRSSVSPFFRNVWPQERSLATPGVSGALSDLPAASGDAFAEAVYTIERFLVPFECWSMINYGLYGEADGAKKLAQINDEEKAKALLQLLDLTVGSAEGATIPHDLADALEQIRSVAPHLVERPTYRRLSAAARR